MTEANKRLIQFLLMVLFIALVIIWMWRRDQGFQEASQIIAREYPAPQLDESLEDSIIKIDHPFDRYVSQNNNLPNQIYAQLHDVGKRAICVYIIEDYAILDMVMVPGSKLSKKSNSDSITVTTPDKKLYRFRLYGVDGHPLVRNESHDLCGLWYGVEKDGSYWEVIYTDSIVWNYSVSFGVLKRRYILDGNFVRKYNMDSTEFVTVEIQGMYPDSMVVKYNDYVTSYHRIDMEREELTRIVRGDSTKEGKYIAEFLVRLKNWNLSKTR